MVANSTSNPHIWYIVIGKTICIFLHFIRSLLEQTVTKTQIDKKKISIHFPVKPLTHMFLHATVPMYVGECYLIAVIEANNAK